VWTPEGIRSAPGSSAWGLLLFKKPSSEADDAQLFVDASGVTAQGNVEGENILRRLRDTDVLAEMHRLDTYTD
jgi:hypothetical protein